MLSCIRMFFCLHVVILYLIIFGKSLITDGNAAGCDDIVCLNNGTCLPNPTIPEKPWTCECPRSFFGDYCQNTNPCLANPEIWCINGTCAGISGRNYTCECDPGFEGPRCSNFNPCVSNPCETGNVCEFLWDNNYRCKCTNLGFYGRYCEKYNNCTTNPCHNDGICTHLGDKNFVCDCDTDNTGYYGDLCELYSLCYKSNPCNSGNCTYKEEGKFIICTCPVGFGGSLCQFIDLCDRDRPCLNYGTCTPLIKDPPEYECHCDRGYLGENCEFAVRCPADFTVDIRGFIQWPITLVHRTIEVDCNFGGMAKRQCVSDERNKPRWKYPDTSSCESVNITRALAKEFTAYLKNITRNAIDMIEEELESSTELLVAVAKYTYDDMSFAEDVMDCVSNLMYVSKDVMRRSSDQHDTSGQLLQLLDGYKEYAEIKDDTNSLSLVREDINIWIKETRIQDSIQGINFTWNNASIYLPREALGQSNEQSRRRVGFISLRKDTFFIEDLNFTDNNQSAYSVESNNECNSNVLTNRTVLSADVVGSTVMDLQNPVVLTLQKPSVNCPFTCGYWDESVNLWKTDGISKKSENKSFITCESDHLTYFSIILDPHYSEDPSAKHQQILSVISYIGCSITIGSLILTIFTYVMFKDSKSRRMSICGVKTRNTNEKLLWTISGKILINLCVALLGMNVAFLLETIPTFADNLGICRGLAMALHYFTLSTFLWMGAEAVHIHSTLIKVFRGNRTNKFMAKCMIISWGVPLIPVVVLASLDLDYYTAEIGCMLSQENVLVYYLSYMGPCLIILAANFVIFFMILNAICECGCKRKTLTHCTTGIRRTHVGCAISITFLLGLTWVLSLFKIGNASIVFHYVFTIVNSLLGFFIFLFRCALNPEALRNWRVCCSNFSQKMSTSADLSGAPNNTTPQTQKRATLDSGHYSDGDYAQTNPNFQGDNKGTNTIMMSVVSQNSKPLNSSKNSTINRNSLKSTEQLPNKQNNYEYIL